MIQSTDRDTMGNPLIVYTFPTMEELNDFMDELVKDPTIRFYCTSFDKTKSIYLVKVYEQRKHIVISSEITMM